MQIAIDESNVRITASNAIKEKNYKCPVCGKDVILRQGSINIRHFAHKACECSDSWHYDMSDWHISMQERFPEEQREVVVSFNGECHRADILKDNMVIEFQHSPISIDELRERNEFYHMAGYKVAWVFDFSEQYEIGSIKDYPREDSTLMYKWNNPKRYLSCLPIPKETNKEIVTYFYWVDVDGEESINKIIWSTKNEGGEPDFKKFIIDDFYFEITEELEVEDFFDTHRDKLERYVSSFGKRYYIKKSGVTGYARNFYVCPKTNEFGIRKLGEKGCLYCKYCAAVKEYSYGFDSYCFFPNVIRETDDVHPGFECSVAPRY